MERQENMTVDNEELIIDNEATENEPEKVTAAEDNEIDNELQNKYLRLAAEYDNFRKRTAKERESLVSESRNYAIKQLLPVLDNLERAAAQACTDEAYAQGVVMIIRQWLEVMEKMGITAIDAQNMPFDPNLHNAVMHGEDDSLPENTIVEVFQKGYMSSDKVLRPSMVKVVN